MNVARLATPSGLPCEVATVLAARCTSCHSDPPRSNAPHPLLTREHLLAPSAVDPAQSYAERAVDPPRERAMGEEQTSGDCNACHTENGGGDGSDAPGRILAP